MTIEFFGVDQRSINLNSRAWSWRPACLRGCLWIEAFLGWASERVAGRVVVEEGGLNSHRCRFVCKL